MSIIKMENLMGVKEDNNEVLGKFLYFSLASILIERDKLAEICQSMNLPISLGGRQSTVDAFKSATGDIYDRVIKKEGDDLKISKIYCRDNQKIDSVYSRELIKETLGESTNRYKKLANICYNKETEKFDYSVESFDSDIDIISYCDKAGELFELYKLCAGRNQIENLTDNFLNIMESLKISVHGRLYFISRKNMHMIDIFEDFIEALNGCNKRNSQLTVNSMHVIDDAKQRDKMTVEFYNATKKEIDMYTEKVEYLITSGSQSPAVMERWITKIEGLEAKKRHYEEILRHELRDLDDQYGALNLLSQELSMRVKNLRFKKCA